MGQRKWKLSTLASVLYQSNRHECFISCIRRIKTSQSMELPCRARKKVSSLNFEFRIDVVTTSTLLLFSQIASQSDFT